MDDRRPLFTERHTLDTVRGVIAGSKLLHETIVRDTGEALTIKQPTTDEIVCIKAMPCSARAGRGLAISTLLENECAHWVTESEGYQALDRVHGSLTPAVAQFQDAGRIILISTPWGRSNLYWRLYEMASSGEHPDMLAVTAPTWDVNPTLPQSFYDAERAKDPENFRGEYGAEFLASGASFFDHERLVAAVNEDRFELAPDEVVAPIAALDASFSKDPSALSIVGRDRDDRKRLRLALARSWRPDGDDLGFSAVLDEVSAICKSYGARHIVVDQHCSVPVREHLQGKGLWAEERTSTGPSKVAIFGGLKALLYSQRLELYPHPELLAELARVEVVYASGGASIRTPRIGGSHCDLAMATAMAAAELADTHSSGAPVRIRMGGREISAGLWEREF